MSVDESALRDILDSQGFYEVMQQYRWVPLIAPRETVKAFEAVKQFLVEQLFHASARSDPKTSSGEGQW